jgi:hypothetical protein
LGIGNCCPDRYGTGLIPARTGKKGKLWQYTDELVAFDKYQKAYKYHFLSP